MRPKGNGLVELVDEKPGKERGFFCMELVRLMWDDEEVKGVGRMARQVCTSPSRTVRLP